jgi:plastocyanin
MVGLALVAAVPAAGVAAAASTRTVTMRNISLSPATVTIKKGDTVKWAWRDGKIRHDVTWKSGGFRASALQAQTQKRALKPYSITFKKTGTFRYACSVHPGDMQGKVIVKT